MLVNLGFKVQVEFKGDFRARCKSYVSVLSLHKFGRVSNESRRQTCGSNLGFRLVVGFLVKGSRQVNVESRGSGQATQHCVNLELGSKDKIWELLFFFNFFSI